MTFFLITLLIVSCVILGFLILVQNPKESGLGTAVGGFGASFSTQFGVKKAANILERGTYIFILLIAILSIVSVYLISDSSPKGNEVEEVMKTAPVSAPSSATPPPVDLPTQPSLPSSPASPKK